MGILPIKKIVCIVSEYVAVPTWARYMGVFVSMELYVTICSLAMELGTIWF